MRTDPSSSNALRPIVATLACVLGVACSRSGEPRGSAADSSVSVTANATSSVAAPAVRAQVANTDPCAWVSRDDVEHILGPLAANPVRIVGAERADPSPDGNGCLYQPKGGQGGEPYALAVEVIVDGGLTLETGLGAQLPGLGEALMAKTSPGEAASEAGLDWAGGVSGIYGARQGHISIMMGDQAPWLAGRASTASRAASSTESRICRSRRRRVTPASRRPARIRARSSRRVKRRPCSGR